MVKKTLIIASSVIATAIIVDEVVSKITKKKPLRKKIMDKGKEIIIDINETKKDLDNHPERVESACMAGGLVVAFFGLLHYISRKIFK